MKKLQYIVIAIGMFVGSFYSHAAGAKLAAKVLEETLGVAAKRSGRVVSKSTKITLSRNLLKITAKHGDDILPLVRKGGLEMLEQGAKHGDDFWRLCKQVPEASRSLALHADELMPLARRIGPEVLELEVRTPGLATRVAREFGDEGVKALAHAPASDTTRLLGYASKADSPATKELLFNTYRKSVDPAKFLDHLNWKHIMAGGLSTATIVAAYKVSDGVEDGLKNPETAGVISGKVVSPFCWGVLVLAGLCFAPWGIGRIRKSVAVWRQK